MLNLATKELTADSPTDDKESKTPDLHSIKKDAVRGAFWTLLSYGLGQILRFGSNLILTRLLIPDLFGLMALVNLIIMGLALFSDLGIGTSIVRSKHYNDPDFLNTGWTMQVIRGFGIWVIAAVIAHPLAEFYNTPQLAWLTPLIAVNAIINGFVSPGLYISYRNLAVKKVMVMELGSQLLCLSIMITWAYLYPSIYALVAGTLISALVHTAWTHYIVPEHRCRFRWNEAAVHELVSFGKWIFVSTALTFLAGQADRMILGKIFSLETLGVYTIAFTLADLPRQLVSVLSGKIIYPTLVRMSEAPRPEFRQKILHNRFKVLLLMASGLSILTCIGDQLILFLYDQRYAQAAWMLPLLALGVWPNMLSQTIDQALFAIGKPGFTALGNLFRFIFNVVAIPLGFVYLGIAGAIIMVALNDLPYYLAIVFGLSRHGLSSLRQDIVVSLILALMISALLYGRWLLGWGAPTDGMVLEMRSPEQWFEKISFLPTLRVWLSQFFQ